MYMLELVYITQNNNRNNNIIQNSKKIKNRLKKGGLNSNRITNNLKVYTLPEVLISFLS